MPRVLELCDDLAGRFLFEPTMVAGYARALREAGLLSTGARGRHAPQATPTDAARLLIPMMLRVKQHHAVEAVELFGSLKPSDGAPFSIAGEQADTFGEALALIIEYCLQPCDESDRSSDVFDRFDFSASINRQLCLAEIDLARFADDGEREDEEGIAERKKCTFVHPDIFGVEITDGIENVPSNVIDDLRRYRSGFHEVPSLFKSDLISIGQVLAGLQPIGWELRPWL